MSKFHWLEKLELDDGQVLMARIAELLPAGPAELLPFGLSTQLVTPIGARPDSSRYEVHFRNVGAFRVVPEPFNELSLEAERLQPFLFKEIASSYLESMEGAMNLANIPINEGVMHYVIYTDNHVVHVLTSSEPKLIVLAAHGP